jgi:hypothetical protein
MAEFKSGLLHLVSRADFSFHEEALIKQLLASILRLLGRMASW